MNGSGCRAKGERHLLSRHLTYLPGYPPMPARHAPTGHPSCRHGLNETAAAFHHEFPMPPPANNHDSLIGRLFPRQRYHYCCLGCREHHKVEFHLASDGRVDQEVVRSPFPAGTCLRQPGRPWPVSRLFLHNSGRFPTRHHTWMARGTPGFSISSQSTVSEKWSLLEGPRVRFHPGKPPDGLIITINITLDPGRLYSASSNRFQQHHEGPKNAPYAQSRFPNPGSQWRPDQRYAGIFTPSPGDTCRTIVRPWQPIRKVDSGSIRTSTLDGTTTLHLRVPWPDGFREKHPSFRLAPPGHLTYLQHSDHHPGHPYSSCPRTLRPPNGRFTGMPYPQPIGGLGPGLSCRRNLP